MNIDQVVYFTDSSLQTRYRDQSTHSYLNQRIDESEKYLDTFAPDCEMSMMEMPDGLSSEEYQAKCFPKSNAQEVDEQMVAHLTLWLRGTDVVFIPMNEGTHPSHTWCNQICTKYIKHSKKNYVLYYCHRQLFGGHREGEPNTSTTRETSIGFIKTFQHRQGEKEELFRCYFPSQYSRFEDQKLKLDDTELYASPTNIDIEPENDVIKMIKI